MKYEIHGLKIFCPYCEKEVFYLMHIVTCPYCEKKFSCELISIYITRRNCEMNKKQHNFNSNNKCVDCGFIKS